MAENKMAQVAEMFGKKMGERFTIIMGNKKLDARFMRYGLELMGAYENPYIDLDSYVLMDLLTGDAEIAGDKK